MSAKLNSHNFRCFESRHFAFALGGFGGRVFNYLDSRLFKVYSDRTYIKECDFEDFTLDAILQTNGRFSFGIGIR